MRRQRHGLMLARRGLSRNDLRILSTETGVRKSAGDFPPCLWASAVNRLAGELVSSRYRPERTCSMRSRSSALMLSDGRSPSMMAKP